LIDDMCIFYATFNIVSAVKTQSVLMVGEHDKHSGLNFEIRNSAHFYISLNLDLNDYCTIVFVPPFLAHLAKGNVSFCHHLASVVCRPSSVNFSHFNLLWNLSAKWSETW